MSVMSNRYQIVVQGEASETDSDDEVYITSTTAPQTPPQGIKVVWYRVQNVSPESPRFPRVFSMIYRLSPCC